MDKRQDWPPPRPDEVAERAKTPLATRTMRAALSCLVGAVVMWVIGMNGGPEGFLLLAALAWWAAWTTMCVSLAERRARNTVLAGFLGLLFGPLAALVYALTGRD